jgi:hypothetical protein
VVPPEWGGCSALRSHIVNMTRLEVESSSGLAKLIIYLAIGGMPGVGAVEAGGPSSVVRWPARSRVNRAG